MEKSIITCNPVLADGKMTALEFTLRAAADGFVDYLPWSTPAFLPERKEPYVQSDYEALANTIADRQGLWQLAAKHIQDKKNAALPPLAQPDPTVIVDPVIERNVWVAKVDDVVADIITKQTRFQMGYIERESAAYAFKEAGYVGDPGIWVTRFADNTKISYQASADIILSQAVQLRQALKDLEALRMDKYLIQLAATQELAQAEFEKIIHAVEAIAVTL